MSRERERRDDKKKRQMKCVRTFDFRETLGSRPRIFVGIWILSDENCDEEQLGQTALAIDSNGTLSRVVINIFKSENPRRQF